VTKTPVDAGVFVFLREFVREFSQKLLVRSSCFRIQSIGKERIGDRFRDC
jgi:hypothetical protein